MGHPTAAVFIGALSCSYLEDHPTEKTWLVGRKTLVVGTVPYLPPGKSITPQNPSKKILDLTKG